MDDKKTKIAVSILKSALIAVIFIVAVTLLADIILPVKDWLKNTFTHHWIGKSVLSLAVFAVFSVIVYFCPCQKNIEKAKKLLSLLYKAAAVGSVIIFLFFVWEAFLK